MAVSSTTGGLRTGVCLSTDRPQNPYNGQVVYETDTNRTLVWDNSAWVVINDPALLSYSGTGATVTADAMTLGGENVVPYTGRKNAIINGDMRVAQRGTSTTFSTGSGTLYYACDRFSADNYTWSGGGQITLSQESSIVPDGFSNSLKISVGSTPLTYNSGGYSAIKYSIEGYDASRFYDGNATLSFWVRSSVAGTYSILIANNWWGTGSADRGLILEYSISQANTWEKKYVTINFSQGTSAGTWGKTNGYGVLFQWFLGANANRVGDVYLDSWANWSAYEVMSSSATQLFTNANAVFYLTGVQLEVGDKATPFEHRSFGEELALCKRYFETSYAYGVAFGTDQASFPTIVQQVPFYAALGQTDGWGGMRTVYTVTKRATPSVAVYRPDGSLGSIQIVYGSTPSSTYVSPTVYGNQNGHMINTSGVAAGSLVKVIYHYTASAEL